MAEIEMRPVCFLVGVVGVVVVVVVVRIVN